MPATAAARRVAATPARRSTASRTALKPRTRTAPARRPAPARRKRGNTPATGFVPVVVGRTVGAVGGVADSGLVVRLTRGRAWIGVLGFLLVGIVAINVWALGLNAASSKTAQETDGLKRANSALQAQIAGELSNEQVQTAADKLGLIVPEPGLIRYLQTGHDAAAIAAKRLANGEFTLGSVAPEVTAVPVVDPAATIVPEAPVTDPVTAPVEDPVTAAPVTAAPAPTTPVTPPPATAGAIGAP